MNQRKTIWSVIAVLFASALLSSISYDIFTNNIKSKDLNLSIAESANRSSMSISSFQYDSGRKGYGAYQNDRYNYEEHQRSYEKRRDSIEDIKTTRDIVSVLIVALGLGISYHIYQKAKL